MKSNNRSLVPTEHLSRLEGVGHLLEETPKVVGNVLGGASGQGRLFQEGEIWHNSSGIDPALVSDWPEIEEQFGWLLHPEKEGR